MNNAEEKKILDLIKEHMNKHGLTSYNIGILDSQIGRIKINYYARCNYTTSFKSIYGRELILCNFSRVERIKTQWYLCFQQIRMAAI